MTRGIVEKVIDKYTILVRLPLYDKGPNAADAVPTESLPAAVICSPPRLSYNIMVGDIVFVSFEDNNRNKPVIVGYLYREALTESQYSDIILGNLEVKNQANLPRDTSIGDISNLEISYLFGLKDNIQYQIDKLNIAISNISINSSNTVI